MSMINYPLINTLEASIISLAVDFASDDMIASCEELNVHVADIIMPDGKVAQVHLSLILDHDKFIEDGLQTVVDLSGGKEFNR